METAINRLFCATINARHTQSKYPWEEGKEENLNIAGGRGRIMNPSEEADHLKRKHERSKTKGSDVRDVLVGLEEAALLLPFKLQDYFLELQGMDAHIGRHVHLVHISHVNRYCS